MNKPLPKRKCKNCNEVFQKKKPLDYVCSPACNTEWEQKKAEKKGKPKKKAIAPVSEKRLGELAEYRVVREKYMKEHPECEVCGEESGEIHHKNGRTNKRLTDDKYFLAVCRGCHNFIHDNPKEAREEGYLI